MPIKRILLPISGVDNIDQLAETAFRAGKLLSAQVEGLFVQSLFLDISLAGETSPEKARRLIQEAQITREEKAKEAERAFAGWAERHKHVESTFAAQEGTVEDIFARRARLSDLTVTGSSRQYDSPFWRDVRDAALFRSGRPVLVMPANVPAGDLPSTVVIAWKESLEASRAVAAAQPFIANASSVHLVTVGEGPDATASLREVEEYLLLHYAEVRSEVLSPSAKGVGDALLQKAVSLNALLVMGAYSHWRWRERVFGGVTETMLDEATVPVLMAH